MFILDSHCDTPSQIYRLRGLSIDNRRGHVDFPKLAKAGVDASFFAIYIPKDLDSEEAFRYANELIDCTQKSVSSNPSYARMCTNAADSLKNKEEGLVSIFLGLENASAIGNEMERLEWFYNRGVRYVTLCHNGDNLVCDSAAQGTTHNGLSAFGREVVRKMNSMGMIIDCAHISDKAFWDVLECSVKPVVSTHSCCRALSGHRRNMSDEMIKAMADKGGVIQINFYPVFLDEAFGEVLDAPELAWTEKAEEEFIKDPSNADKRALYERAEDVLLALERPSYRLIADHIDHAVEIAGVDHVGIGSDFDGICVPPAGMEDISKLGLLFKELERRGYNADEIAKIAGGNFLRVMNLCGVS